GSFVEAFKHDLNLSFFHSLFRVRRIINQRNKIMKINKELILKFLNNFEKILVQFKNDWKYASNESQYGHFSISFLTKALFHIYNEGKITDNHTPTAYKILRIFYSFIEHNKQLRDEGK